MLDVLLGLCITGVGFMLRLSVIEYSPMNMQKIIALGLEWMMAIFAGVAALMKFYTVLVFPLLEV